MHLAYNPRTWNLKYYYDYVGTTDIFILDHELAPRYGIRLWEAYPKTINAIELSNTTENEIARLTVSMEFRYWSNILKYGDQEPTVATTGTGDPDLKQASQGRDRRALERRETARMQAPSTLANKPKKIVSNHSRTRRPPGIGAG